MKELSIEEKAKRYELALERCRKLYNEAKANEYTSDIEDYETIFPELKEPEDEKIRKSLIKFLKDCIRIDSGYFPKYCEISSEQMIAWLEKQGEQKPYGQREECLDCQFNYAGECKGFCQMKRGEQKSADKVEPKFHKGEWIVWQNKCYKVNDTSCGYELIDQNGLSTFLEYGTIDESAHLWDISKDAKDGDVLTESKGEVILMFRGIGNTEWNDVIDYHCYYDCYRKNFILQDGVDHWGDIKNNQLKPATKEQRDTLMKAMADAGYTFDFEKKELKKIEQKPAWSEEDNKWIESLIQTFEDEYLEGFNQLKSYGVINWLKSIKHF